MQYDQFGKLDISVDDECVVIFDEAHLLKTPGTQLHAAVSSMPSRKRIMLTGTPLQNNLDEYYTMTELIAPGLLGASLTQFRQSYASIIEKGMLKDSTDLERKQSERTTQVLRWQMESVMHDKSAAYLKLSIPTKKEYCVALSFPPVAEMGNPITEYHTISDLTRERKVSVIDHLIGIIQDINPDEGVIVFSNRHETLHALHDKRPGLIYTGSVAGSKRTSVLNEFEENGGILYIATKAGGTGLNLARGSRVILADVSFNPVYDTQAVARIYRMGQVRPTVVYRIIACNTLEERIYRMNVQKHAMAARIKDDQDSMRLYTREELKTLTSPMTSIAIPVDIKDIADVGLKALVWLVGGVDIYDHDSLFTDFDAQLSPDEINSARHDYHRMLSQNPRMLYIDDDAEKGQMVQPGQLYFDEPHADKLVPAYPPTFRVDDDKNKVIITLGPSPYFEIEKKNVDDGEWVKLNITPNTELAVPEIVVLLKTGVYQFRSRTIVPTSDEIGPWSEESSELYIP